MALTAGEKLFLGGLGVLFAALLAGAASGSGRDVDLDDYDDDDDDDDELPPGRAFELSLLEAHVECYGERHVLDQATVTADDGSTMRPDAIILNRRGTGVVEVREAKDVRELRTAHILQAVRYDEALRPRDGTTIDIAEDTDVPREVRRLARLLDIGIERW